MGDMSRHTDLRLTIASLTAMRLRRQADELSDSECVAMLTDFLDVAEGIIEDIQESTSSSQRRRVRVKEASERLGLDSDGRWRDFLTEHPELEPEPVRSVDFRTLQDSAIVAAVAEAIRQWNGYYSGLGWDRYRQGAGASDVARVLIGGTACSGDVGVSRGDVTRAAQRLAKLARAGAVKVVSRSWQPTRYAPA